jgi:hypothetical protein
MLQANTVWRKKKESVDKINRRGHDLRYSESTGRKNMAGPKGDKRAKEHPKSIGRPMEYDLDEEAAEILKWAKKEESIHLAQFAIERNVPAGKLSYWAGKSTVFRESLAKAKDILNIKVRDRINDPNKHYNERLAMRDISNYDTLLKICERDDLAYASSLKQKEAEAQAHTLAELKHMSATGELSQK